MASPHLTHDKNNNVLMIIDFFLSNVLILYRTFGDDEMFSDGTFSDGMFNDETVSDGTFCIIEITEIPSFPLRMISNDALYVLYKGSARLSTKRAPLTDKEIDHQSTLVFFHSCPFVHLFCLAALHNRIRVCALCKEVGW